MKIFDLSQNWYQFVLIAVLSYCIGCFNFALLISRKKHRDITKIGSGNPGTMNMTREFGLKVGLITFFCDALKGGVAAAICFFLYRDYVFKDTTLPVSDFIRYFSGLFVVLGHIYPVTLRFKGGKGIASTLGLFWISLSCRDPWWILIGFAFLLCIILYIYRTEWGSMGSLLGVSGFSIIQMLFFLTDYAQMTVNAYMVCLYMLVFVINVLTWAAHRENLKRVFVGEERRTSLKKLAKKK